MRKEVFKQALGDKYKDIPIEDKFKWFSFTCRKYHISKQKEFLSQILHESNSLLRTEESLNYSSSGLLKVFRKYFDEADAEKFKGNPKAIANRVYGGRMGNNEEGDGWRFRGRGYIQLTGKNNYTKFGKEYPEILDNPDLICEKEKYAWLSAGWFWKENKIDQCSSFEDMTRKINGGLNGIEHRCKLLEMITKIEKEVERIERIAIIKLNASQKKSYESYYVLGFCLFVGISIFILWKFM